MCLGGGGGGSSQPKTPEVKPIPAPPPVTPAPPPREPAAPRKPIEEPTNVPDVQLGAQKKTQYRSSLKPQSNAGSVSPNTGTTPGALNI